MRLISQGTLTLITLAVLALLPAAPRSPSFAGSGLVTTAFPRRVPSGSLVAFARLADGRLVAGGYFYGGYGLTAYRPNGALDPAFGHGGRQPLAISEIQALASQPDGQLLVAGWRQEGRSAGALIFRVRADGSPDPGFGTSGSVERLPALGYFSSSALALYPDGRILVAGESTDGCFPPPCGPVPAPAWTLDRYLRDGTADPTLPERTLAFSTGWTGDPDQLLVQADGTIWIAGPAGSGGTALARLLPDGTPDPNFGQDGVVIIPNGMPIASLTVQADGTLLASGVVAGRLAAARYRPDGTLDPTFGAGGITPAGPAATGAANLILQPDGQVLVGGTAPNPAGSDLLVVRFQPDGSLDSGFATGGSARVDFGQAELGGRLALNPDGTMVLVGTTPAATSESPDTDLILARLTAGGALDPAFGSGGTVRTVTTASQAQARALVAQPDGRLVAAGAAARGPSQSTFALARYLPDGSLDPTFGTAGRVQTDLGGVRPQAMALVLQPDGKFVAAGGKDATSNDCGDPPTFARYDSAGLLDPSFGHAGVVTFTLGNSCGGGVQSLALQPDGKLVASGFWSNGSFYDFDLWRLLPNGQLDPAFGSGGQVTTSFSGAAVAEALVLQPDGKILAAGWANFPAPHVALARYLPGGGLDSTFGTAGRVETTLPMNAQGQALALQPDGKIVVGGRAWTGQIGALLLRYLPSGTLDPAFGPGGYVWTPRSSPSGVYGSPRLAIQLSGRIVLADGAGYFLLLGYRSDGSLDPGFGAGGQTQVDFGGSDDAAALVLAPDGSLRVAGTTVDWSGRYDHPDTLFALAEVAADGCAPQQFRDVPADAYFYPPIHYLVRRAVLSGYDDCTFRPFAATTRGQLAKIIVGAAGWTINTAGGPHFSDVPASNPFYTFIETAYNHGIISGYGDGTFRWGADVTRGQLSKIVVGAQGWTITTTGGPHFTDVPATNPFYPFVETAFAHGIISGYADNTFRMGADAVRAQISKIVYIALTTP